MAKNSIRDFSATAGSNTDIQSVNIDENCPASGINNAIRELMVDLKNVSTGAINLETPAADQLNVDNLRLDGNSITSTDTNGNINITPNGTGAVAFTTNATFGDNDKAIFGAGSDLQIYHNGTSSFIEDTGSGDLFIRGAANVQIEGSTAGENMIYATENGAVRLYYDANQKLATTSAGVDVTGTVTADGVVKSGATGSNGQFDLARTSDGLSVGKITMTEATQVMDYHNLLGSGIHSFSVNSTERLRIDSSGRLLMGVTGPTNGGESFYVDAFDGFRLFCSRGSTALREQIVFHNPNGDVGSIDTDGSSTSYNTSSDHRLKENAVDMTGAITRVKALAPKRFNFIADADTTVDGFLAHEAQAVVPESVTGTHNEVDSDGNPVMQGIDQSKLVPLLTAALKESIAKIETLETEMTALKARVTALEA